MRKLTAVLTTLVTALAVLVIGGIAAPASAHVTSPANGAVLRGAATLSASGGYDDSTFDHCSWFGGDGGNTRIQLINSSGHAVVNQFWDTGGARSITIDTHDFPNGSYTVRATEGVRKNSGFGGFGCKTETHTNNRSVTIDNITRIEYQGDTSGPQNTMATVRAKLTDPHLSGQVLANRPVRFTLGSSTKTVDTNGSGIASTTPGGNRMREGSRA